MFQLSILVYIMGLGPINVLVFGHRTIYLQNTLCFCEDGGRTPIWKIAFEGEF